MIYIKIIQCNIKIDFFIVFDDFLQVGCILNMFRFDYFKGYIFVRKLIFFCCSECGVNVYIRFVNGFGQKVDI